MDSDTIEYAEADSVQVLETNILHASDVVYWLNGVTAEDPSQMQRLDQSLDLQLMSKPRDAKVINSQGKTAVLRKPTLDILNGIATEVDKTRPAVPTYSFSGAAWDPARRFNPVQFDLTLGAGNGENVILYPSPLGTRVTPGGYLYGALHMDGGDVPLIWALLELTVTISSGVQQIYRAQCDAKGDFRIALTRLPPLPSNLSGYAAVLRATANTGNSADTAPDTSSYSAVKLQAGGGNNFNIDYTLTVIPGQRLKIQSNAKDYLAASTP